MDLHSAWNTRFVLLPWILLACMSVVRAQDPSTGQTCELRGEVDRADGSPYRDGALVKIEDERGGLAAQLRTDSGGRFETATLQRSHYSVTVHALGFREASSTADLTTIPRAFVRITLHEVSSPATAPVPVSPSVSVSELSIPEAARSEFDKGRVLLVEKHKPADSVKPFLKAIQIAPAYSQAEFLLGTAYMDLGKWSDAEAALSKAISLNDKLASAYLALGVCLIEEKKFAEAEKPLVGGLEFLPDAAQGHYDLGRTYYALNRFPEAETQARKAIELEPGLPEAHLLMGNVLLRLRDGSNALAEFQEYLRLAPDGTFAGPVQELIKKLQAGLAESH
jgi:Tfp pilus assembly protein PilF